VTQPFLERLDEPARKLLLSVARPVSFAKGARLVRHGEAARGAWVLGRGSAEATVVLPGGENLTVAKLAAGDMFGEMALVERGSCTATVAATADIDGWFVGREDFRALVAQRDAVAQSVQHAVTLVLAEKLRALNARVLEVEEPGDKPAARPEREVRLEAVKRLKKAPFDVRSFLPLLPFFEGFDESEIDEVVSVSSLLELPRGQTIFASGHASAAVFIVLRGAVEIIASHAGRERRMAVLGPGQIVGYMSLLEGRAHGSDGRVREDALLLEIARNDFEMIYFVASSASTKLHRAIQRSLLSSLGQTNRHLTRLISLARLRGAEKQGDSLESALSGQIVAAN
jgi:CRP-like cAMP-binding protein